MSEVQRPLAGWLNPAALTFNFTIGSLVLNKRPLSRSTFSPEVKLPFDFFAHAQVNNLSPSDFVLSSAWGCCVTAVGPDGSISRFCLSFLFDGDVATSSRIAFINVKVPACCGYGPTQIWTDCTGVGLLHQLYKLPTGKCWHTK